MGKEAINFACLFACLCTWRFLFIEKFTLKQLNPSKLLLSRLQVTKLDKLDNSNYTLAPEWHGKWWPHMKGYYKVKSPKLFFSHRLTESPLSPLRSFVEEISPVKISLLSLAQEIFFTATKRQRGGNPIDIVMWSIPPQKSLKVFTSCEATVTFDPPNLISWFSSPSRKEFASAWKKLPEGMWLHWPLTSKIDLAHPEVQGDERFPKTAAPRPLNAVSLHLIRLSVRQRQCKVWRKSIEASFQRYSAQTSGQHRDRSPRGLALARLRQVQAQLTDSSR